MVEIAVLSKMEAVIRALTAALSPYSLTVCQSKPALLDAVATAHVVVAQNPGFPFHTIDAEILNHAPKLRLIQQFGVSWDVTDESEAARRAVPVATIAEQSSTSVAEHGFHLLLCLAKRLKEQQKSIRQRQIGQCVSTELSGKTVCIIGLGKIGKILVRLARGFSMQVVGVKKRLDVTAGDLGIDILFPPHNLAEALSMADFVILAIPLNKDTFNLIGPEQFGKMKRGTMLVNISRGAHVNKEALTRALDDGQLSGYAADAFWEEPMDPEDPLLRCDRVIVTPHVGGITDVSLEGAARAVRENICRLIDGKPLLHVINMRDA